MKRLHTTYILPILLAGAVLSTACKTEKVYQDPCEEIYAGWSKCVSTGAIQNKGKLSKSSFIDACKNSTQDKNKIPSHCSEKQNCELLDICTKGMLTVDLFGGAADALAGPEEKLPRFQCMADADCVNSCANGAVNAAWYARAQKSKGFSECEDGCNNQISEPPRCEDGACVAYQHDPRDEKKISPRPACTRVEP